MQRRRVMLSAGERKRDYIKNGLVLWLDGIDKGGNANAWTDLVSGFIFMAYGSVAFLQDHIHISNGGYLRNSGFLSPIASESTIEVVFNTDNPSTNQILYQPSKANNGIMFSYSYSRRGIITSSAPSSAGTSAYTPMFRCDSGHGTYSASADRGVQNGVNMPYVMDNGFTSFSNYNTIGKRDYQGSEYRYTGRIYCIRIYNRILSEDEAVQNYNVDKLRFQFIND